MGKTILICTISFVLGAMATAAPFLIAGHFAHLDEVARGEPTMGPGITTFLGLLASPVGGTVALLIGLWIIRRRRGHSVTDQIKPQNALKQKLTAQDDSGVI